ncbi:MAG: hypothetical protein KDA16_11920 [Phycisphaerales bacterium]|nr:hypothetical protein [Phycisphaerales bacterium]
MTMFALGTRGIPQQVQPQQPEPAFDRRIAIRDLERKRRVLVRDRIAAAHRGDRATADALNEQLRRVDDEGQALMNSIESRYIRDPGEVAASRARLQESADAARRTSATGLIGRADTETQSLARDREARYQLLGESETPRTARDIARADRIARLTSEAKRDAQSVGQPLDFAPVDSGAAPVNIADERLVRQVRDRYALNARAEDLAQQDRAAGVERAATDAALARDIQTGVLTGTLRQQELAAAEAERQNKLAESEAGLRSTQQDFEMMQNQEATDVLRREIAQREKFRSAGDSGERVPGGSQAFATPEQRVAEVRKGVDAMTNIGRTINSGNLGRATADQINGLDADITALETTVIPALAAMVDSGDPQQVAVAREIADQMLRSFPEYGNDGTIGITTEFVDAPITAMFNKVTGSGGTPTGRKYDVARKNIQRLESIRTSLAATAAGWRAEAIEGRRQ